MKFSKVEIEERLRYDEEELEYYTRQREMLSARAYEIRVEGLKLLIKNMEET
jgi:hypothetical protein